MRRVVILGRGGAGKSVLARQLSELTGIPAIELDGLFWQPGAVPTPAEAWVARHRELVAGERWIIDGDLGPYDAGLTSRLAAADTIIVLDFGFLRCAWRTLRRGREQAEYWRWVWSYRRQSLPKLRMAIAAHLPRAQAHVLRNPAMVRRFLADIRGPALTAPSTRPEPGTGPRPSTPRHDGAQGRESGSLPRPPRWRDPHPAGGAGFRVSAHRTARRYPGRRFSG